MGCEAGPLPAKVQPAIQVLITFERQMADDKTIRPTPPTITDIDSIDLEVDTENPDEFINAVRFLGPSFGGINLEDIKAPECFIIEERLRELMDIPVFHDDQHGTAIIAAAGMLNAIELTHRD